MKTAPHPYHHGNLREALLQAAENTLEKNGVPNLSLRELSRELGVSHTSPRRHFADKQALLDALAQRGFERFSEALSRSSKDERADINTRLAKLSRAYVSFAVKHPALCGLMFEAKHRAGAPPELLEASERAFSHMPSIIREGQAKGKIIFGDPSRLSLVIAAALQGLVAISTNGKVKGVSLDILVPEIVERIILGLRPRL